MAKTIFFNRIAAQWRTTAFLIGRFRTIFRLYYLKHDLENLVKWAARKRLKPIQQHYKRLHSHTEERLAEFRMRFPKTYTVAEIAYSFYLQLAPTPTYHKGSAARYSLRN